MSANRRLLGLFCLFCFIDYGHFSGLASLEMQCTGSNMEFRCRNGRCIDALRVCDMLADCSDSSDEENCGSSACDPVRKFRCSGGECIDMGLVCDGGRDCPSGDDEQNCHPQKVCLPNQFTCGNGLCVPSLWRCDEKDDCGDNSDERNCSKKRCDAAQFMCADGTCIPGEYRCDGVMDCLSGEDEQHCLSGDRCPVAEGYFLCQDSSGCLRRDLVCNGVTNCKDGSDEGGSCGDVCRPDIGCEYGCSRTPLGQRCYCSDGFKLSPNNRSCDDVNECEKPVDVCDHYCYNQNGSYSCKCAEGYQLLLDNATCRIEDPAILIFTVGMKVVAKVLDNSASWILWQGHLEPSGVAYDPLDEQVYWIVEKTILFKKLYGSLPAKTFMNQGLGKPENLALDWIGRNIYVTDYEKQHILVCSLAEARCFPILRNLGHPRALQLDLAERYIYWTDVLSHTIERAGLDGSKRTKIIGHNVTWPNGLALDYPVRKMFWADAHFDHIQTSDFSGQNRKTMPMTNMGHVFSLAVWEDRLYWTDWQKGKHREIHSCRKRDGRMTKTEIKEETNQVSNLLIYHPSLFATAGDPCKFSFGRGCSHLCLLSPSTSKGFVCGCPEGMTLLSNGLTCQDEQRLGLVLAIESSLFSLHLPKYGKSYLEFMNYGQLALKTVADMDYHPVKDLIFFADSQNGEISALNRSSGSVEVIIRNILQPIGIAIDWIRDNLYWINGHHRTIEVARISGHYRNVVVKDIKAPSSIAIDAIGGFLYASDNGIMPAIHQYDLNGNNGKVLAETAISNPVSICFDPTSQPKRIFWADRFLGRIESVEADGSGRRIEVDFAKEPTEVIVDSENIMWTELKTPLLAMVSKSNTSSEFLKYRTINLDIDGVNVDFNGEWMINMVAIGSATNATKRNPCHQRCHQLCFSKNKYQPVCGCAQGLALNGDNSTCSVAQCHENEMKCNDGECIPKTFWCDNDNDCEDGSDETNCQFHLNCSEQEFQCKNNVHCKPRSDICDGLEDCSDRSDEDPSVCKSYNCSDVDEWKCGSGECIPRQWRCDRTSHCSDSSDELACETVVCKQSEKRCNDGWCIPQLWWCDGAHDCADGEDEINCPCKLGEYKCRNGSCIDKAKLCKGEAICTNESLTLNCLEYQKGPLMLLNVTDITLGSQACEVDWRPCSTSPRAKCVPFHAWCNGSIECSGGEDEKYCKTTCQDDYVKCAGQDSCIPKKWRCDGAADCIDGSDEEGCKSGSISEPGCSPDFFECSRGICIPLEKVCDGRKDCLYGVDESKNCNKCSYQNGGCDQICKNGKCLCKEGYALNPDGISCSDLNECGGQKDLCHHNCVNTKGSYVCTCNPGYELKDDRVTCKAVDGLPWSVATVSDEALTYLDDNLNVFRKSALKNILGLDRARFIYNPTNNFLMALDGVNGRIFSVTSGDRWIQEFNNFSSLTAADFDYVNDNMYLAEASVVPRRSKRAPTRKLVTTTIKVCNFRSKLCGTLKSLGSVDVSSLKVSPKLRKMALCQNDQVESKGRIFISRLDASSWESLVNDKILSCSSIAMDELKKRVYWIDSKRNLIESVDILGHDRQKFDTIEVHGARGLAVIDHSLLWFNSATLMMVKCLLQNPKKCLESYQRSEISIIDLHQTYNEDVVTPCPSRNCPHLCMPSSPEVPHCLCADNYEFKNQSCRKMKPTLNVINPCFNNPCLVGVCEFSGGVMTCRCPPGYEGPFCEIEVEINNWAGWEIAALVLSLLVLVFLFFCIWCFKKKSWNNFKLLRDRPYGRFHFVNTSTFGLMKEEGSSQPPTPPIPRFNLQPKSAFQVVSTDPTIAVEDCAPLYSNDVDLSSPLPPKTSLSQTRASGGPPLDYSPFRP